MRLVLPSTFFFFNDTATTEIYTLSLHDALPICIDPPRVIVFLDEIEKAFAGTGTDLSGVKTEMTGTMLTWMQDNEADGLIFIGPPGAAKSAVAKATGNTAGIPTIAFDLGAMQSSLVGGSGERLRSA